MKKASISERSYLGGSGLGQWSDPSVTSACLPNKEIAPLKASERGADLKPDSDHRMDQPITIKGTGVNSTPFLKSEKAPEILLSRNRVKEPHKVYLYEAQINILSGFAGGTVSENVHAIVAAFLGRIGKKMPYLKKRDIMQIKEIRRAITALR